MFKTLENKFATFYLNSGGIILTFLRAVSEFRLGRSDRSRLLQQLNRVGWETVPITLLIGLFTGMTVSLATGFVLSFYGQESSVAGIVSEAMIKEMGPVFTAFILSARVGAAMTAELGTMAVTDAINVLRVLGIRVNRYLTMPRVIASIIMTPALTVYATCMGLLGGALVANNYFHVSWISFRQEAFRYVDYSEIYKGLLKALVFGIIYSTVCCYKGLTTQGGAKGVGNSTTNAVVISLAGILIANYILTRFLFG